VAEIEAVDRAAPPPRAELVSLCRERLASYKIPREFRFVETLPTTASGKVIRWDG
jgi:acyl-coenzyme A synthetase/AMP-(fatty) acid ligase